MDRRSARVLVVDDEELVRRFTARVLEAHGYVVTAATNGAAALEIVDGDAPFDLVITDVAMPEMTGVQLGAALRARSPNLSILYFTGYANRLFDDVATLCEREAFLEKPVSPTALLEAVSQLLFDDIQGLAGAVGPHT